MRRNLLTTLGLGALALAVLGAPEALAQAAVPLSGVPAGEMVGAPHNWGVDLQAPGGIVKQAIHDFNDLVLYIIIAITVFVGALMAYTIWRFDARRNPIPSRTSHNTIIEIAWTVVPVLILLAIAIPSFRLIYFTDRTRDPEVTVAVQGRQWYWHYAYPDNGNFQYDSYPIADNEIRPEQGQIRSLSVDNPLVIPVGANIRVLTTGHDVIHSFFVPSLGIQKYTIPGRTMEAWMRADRVGTFYGQCNQICGTNHWFMPIAVRAVPREEYDAWVAQARTRFAEGQAPGWPDRDRAVMTANADTAAPQTSAPRTGEVRR